MFEIQKSCRDLGLWDSAESFEARVSPERLSNRSGKHGMQLRSKAIESPHEKSFARWNGALKCSGTPAS